MRRKIQKPSQYSIFLQAVKCSLQCVTFLDAYRTASNTGTNGRKRRNADVVEETAAASVVVILLRKLLKQANLSDNSAISAVQQRQVLHSDCCIWNFLATTHHHSVVKL